MDERTACSFCPRLMWYGRWAVGWGTYISFGY